MDRNLSDYLSDLHYGRQSTHLTFETLRCINLFKKMRLSSEYAGGDKHKLIRELFGDNLRLDAGFAQNMHYLSCTYMYFEPIDIKFRIQQTLKAVTVVLYLLTRWMSELITLLALIVNVLEEWEYL